MDMWRMISVIAIIWLGSFHSCVDEPDPEGDGTRANGEVDGISRATPDGGELKPAPDGPVRSVLGQPVIDLSTFELTIGGLVDSSYSLSWEEILAMPAASTDTMLMYCVEGWEVWGVWKGILVSTLLDSAGIQDDGAFVGFGCSDGYTTSLPVSYLKKHRAMLAYEVNGAPLQIHDGFPLRLIAFGKLGYKWAKWVQTLTVRSDSHLGYWEMLGYSDQADVPLERRRYYEGDTVKPLEF